MAGFRVSPPFFSIEFKIREYRRNDVLRRVVHAGISCRMIKSLMLKLCLKVFHCSVTHTEGFVAPRPIQRNAQNAILPLLPLLPSPEFVFV